LRMALATMAAVPVTYGYACRKTAGGNQREHRRGGMDGGLLKPASPPRLSCCQRLRRWRTGAPLSNLCALRRGWRRLLVGGMDGHALSAKAGGEGWDLAASWRGSLSILRVPSLNPRAALCVYRAIQRRCYLTYALSYMGNLHYLGWVHASLFSSAHRTPHASI